MKIKNDFQKLFRLLSWLKPDLVPFLPGLAIIIFIGVVGALISVGTALISKSIVDYAVAANLRMAGLACLLFGLLIIFRMIMLIGASLLSIRVREKFSNVMRQRIFGRLLASEWQSLSAYHSGDLLTRLTSDVSNITSCFTDVVPSIVTLGAQLVASFFALFYFEPILAVFAFVLGPLTVLFSRVWGRKLKYLHKKVQESESSYRSYIQEGLQNFAIIKSFQLEQDNYDHLQELHNKRMKWILKRNNTTLAANNIMGIGYWISYGLAFGWGIIGLANKTITYGTFTAFIQLIQQVQAPFIGLAGTFPRLIAMIGSSERLMELEAMTMEKRGDPVPKLDQVGIEFQEVDFAYGKSKIVLNKLTESIKPGELIALIGPSGEGKTTIIRLLLALLRAKDGEVCFTDPAGKRYEASAATRDWLTYVPQGNTLFSGTIADNLRNGKPDATSEEMEEALRAACAWDFVQELSGGLNTVIGERGLGLSEGQAQRIAIARAFLKKAPILILDEATSALDVGTEANILKSLKKLRHLCTCLVITHRPSALRICSRILRIKDGKLIEEKNLHL
ncbi:ABC transporter ATP-binding protein [Dehalobacter sp. UNSWDHB]|uniref:ABC transporter ATP-binding protein n=1 Tax=Dehalobacter sp. UNSWDHB TaxID=1339256 RepID=UPI0005525AC5|nr:ABC transporter ATP-binding protein [Dehalobacter sp. UNSWDHB]